MKEYLVKDNKTGRYYQHVKTYGDDAIEIPEGAVKAIIDSASSYGFPEKKVYFIFMVDKKEYGIFNGEFREIFYANSTIIWSRHTQPEELPFVDDDCVPKLDEGSKLGNFVVDDTLQARQSQYGDFNDVAHTTQLFLDQFALGRLSSVQKESLHMICSKLARIAHGDPNHIDSWHDIAGYATLVVKDIS